MTATVLEVDFDALTVEEIDFLEDTLNEKLLESPGWPAGTVVTFADIVDQFRRDENGNQAQGIVKIPQGKIMRALALLQIRKGNPAATWEDAGRLRLNGDPKAVEPLPAPSIPSPPTSDA